MTTADTEAYEEVIDKLMSYISHVSDASSDINRAGVDCVDNTEGDPAAVRSNENLQGTLRNINESLDTVKKVCDALRDELENIKAASQSAY